MSSFYHSYTGCPYYYRGSQRQYPEVEVDIFIKSTEKMSSLISDAEKILEKIRTSHDFALQLKNSAQNSQHAEVQQLLLTANIQSIVKSDFNPDGLLIQLETPPNQIECCRLKLSIRW